MRLIKNLFTVADNEKVTEKHMMRVLISTVCSVLICMTCLVSTTWAWYTATVTSEGNVLDIGQWTPIQSIAETEETTEATTEATETETTEVTVETTVETTEETTEEITEETTEPSTEAAEETTEATQAVTEDDLIRE